MQLISELEADHRLIESVAGSLVRFADRAEQGATEAADVADFVRFLRVFVTGYHHDREEEGLFPVLVEAAEVPADRGPLAVMRDDHRAGAAMVAELEAVAAEPSRASAVARRIAHHLWEHIDKEDSVLFPEARQRLVRGGVNHLEGRPARPDEEEARALGERLVARFPPLDDPEVIRGDGCIACSAFTVTCGGIEKEWWNTWEAEWRRSLDEG